MAVVTPMLSTFSTKEVIWVEVALELQLNKTKLQAAIHLELVMYLEVDSSNKIRQQNLKNQLVSSQILLLPCHHKIRCNNNKCTDKEIWAEWDK